MRRRIWALFYTYDVSDTSAWIDDVHDLSASVFVSLSRAARCDKMRIILTGSLAALMCSSGFADSTQMEFILRGMLSERQKLKSAVLRISGMKVSESRRNPEENLSGRLEIFGALDEARQRWDASEPGWIVTFDGPTTGAGSGQSSTKRLVQGTSTKGTVGRKTFRRPDKSGTWIVGNPLISLTHPDAP